MRKQTVQLFGPTGSTTYENAEVKDWGIKYISFVITDPDGIVTRYTSTLPFLIISQDTPQT
jgi:hypothetical protein